MASIRRRLIILGFGIFSFLPLSGDSVGRAAQERKSTDSRKLVALALENFVSAWNEKNSESVTRLFVADAVLVLPSGSVTRSRASIRQRLVSEWSGKLKDSKLTHSVQVISVQGKDAVVKGRYRLDGVTILGFKTEGPFVLRQTNQQGRWMIAKAEILRNPD